MSYRLASNRLNYRNIIVAKKAGTNEVRSVYKLKVYILFNKEKSKQSLFNTLTTIPVGKKRFTDNSFEKNNPIIKTSFSILTFFSALGLICNNNVYYGGCLSLPC